MSFLFRPAVYLMNKLKYSLKFMVVGGLAVIVAVFLAYQLIMVITASHDFSSKEIDGLKLLTPIVSVLKEVQNYRNLTIDSLEGTTDTAINAENIHNEINKHMMRVDEENSKQEGILRINNDWARIKDRWNRIQENERNGQLKTQFTPVTTLLNDLQKLIVTVCDNSNLTLDPDIDTYYLMDTYCTKLPAFVTEAGLIKNIGMQALSKKALAQNDREALIISSTLLNDFNKNIIVSNIQKVVAYNEKLSPVLNTNVINLSNETKANVQALHSSLLANNFSILPQDFSKSFTQLIDVAYLVYADTGKYLEELIQIRLNNIKHQYTINLIISIVGFLLLIYLFVSIYISIISNVKKLISGTENLAKGNFQTKLTSDSHDELAQVINSFNLTIEGLEKLVKNIKNMTNTIHSAATEISKGNEDLARRTEQQAAFLEQTAASMEQVTAIVKRNAENATEADKLAKSASNVATEGGVMVNKVIDTMTAINDSSHKVSEIISVIDNIAFQTNILALNAAVEAARAGEQGRGFAVVAAEVRNLAQRASTAAQEIKTLITQSVEYAASGAGLADQTGRTMANMLEAVRKVTTIMSEIANASIEQSNGIQQVNQAVNQMDKVTQQNSGLVEEAARAAKSMEEQTMHMDSIVHFFKLSKTDLTAQEIAGISIPLKPLEDKTKKNTNLKKHSQHKKQNVWEEF